MSIFRIIHPNGCQAQVRALRERIAIDLLVNTLHDDDWEFAQTSIISQETGPAAILMIGTPQIPTRQAE